MSDRISEADRRDTSGIPESDYDNEVFQRLVSDAGRWAYGVVLVEVWVMNEHKTHLIRPDGGFWVDPVSIDYGQNNNKFQRLIDQTLDDYLPPTPQPPGAGIPGMLWAQASRGNVAVEPTSSIRNGTIFGGISTRRGHRRNRTLFDTIRGGTIFGGGNFDMKINEADTTANNDANANTENYGDIEYGSRPPLHRRSATMDDAALAATKKAHSPSSNKRKHRRLFSDGPSNNNDSIRGGRWKQSWQRSFRATSAGTHPSDRLGTGIGGGTVYPHNHLLLTNVRWRRIADLINDPDQPFNPRISYLEDECGLGFVAGVPFHIGTAEGIVVYFARKTAEVTKLVDTTNEEYLSHSALVIGSAYALRGPRLVAERERRLESQRSFRLVKAKLKAILGMHRDVKSFVADGSKLNLDTDPDIVKNQNGDVRMESRSCHCSLLCNWKDRLNKKLTSCYRKFFGAQIDPPPPFSWEQTAITFVGTCVTLSVLIGADSLLVVNYGKEYGIVLGPFGALTTLLFSLTSAPASQPRNVVFGQLLCLFIAFGFGRSNIDHRLKACLATSISISLMARLGITHPPAGASALIFSSGVHNLSQIGLMLLANLVAIVLGAWCNNISDKRQYPTSWSFYATYRCFNDCRVNGTKCVECLKPGEKNPTDKSLGSKMVENLINSHAERPPNIDAEQSSPRSNISRTCEKEETIDLKDVLAQARNPLMVVHPSTTIFHQNTNLVDRRIDDENHSNCAIDLSEVINVAQRPENPRFLPTDSTTNVSFVRLVNESKQPVVDVVSSALEQRSKSGHTFVDDVEHDKNSGVINA